MRILFTSLAAVMITTPLIYFFQSCASSSSHSDPVAASGNPLIKAKVELLRDGFNGYTGTRDTTVYASPSDWSATGIPGGAATAQSMTSVIDIGQANTQRSFAIISFDVTGVANDLLQTGEACNDRLEVVRAELNVFSGIGPATAFVTATPLLETAPAWTEADATYTAANTSANWPTTPNANQPILNSVNLGYQDAVEGVANSGVFRHFIFDIYVESVKSWICDASKNKGILLRYHSSASGFAQFFTSEFPERSFRPSLTLWLRRI